MTVPRVERLSAALNADPARTVAQLFLPGEEAFVARGRSRSVEIVARVLGLSEPQVRLEAARVLTHFAGRHSDFVATVLDHAAVVASRVGSPVAMTHERQVVLGATFTAEYAVEGAALCNPSAVPHPDQTGLADGQLRLAVSLRAIGEGHVSSIAFVTAVVGPGRRWVFDGRGAPPTPGVVTPGPAGRADLAAVIDDSGRHDEHSTYQVTFPRTTALAQRVLLPVAPEESRGMEDARFTRFTDVDGVVDYRATYTAYDGSRIVPRAIRSADLRTFRTHRLAGPAAHNKGMALFPRTVGGAHLALCRTDGESTSVARSDDGQVWGRPTVVHRPTAPWELVQVGNCGPPIETPEGWLVLTHGVGPMRVYSIGAILLDLDDPTRLLARTEEPLLAPADDERDGYVPNVVYSCGGAVHDGRLWIPYGVDDVRIAVAVVDLDRLLASMTRS